MKLVLYDTETTGLGPKDEVIQYCCMILDESLNLMKIHDVYCMSTIQIDPGAFKVHNLTREFIYEKSHGKFFEELFEDIKKDFDDDIVIFVAFNDKFDMRLINQTLINANLPVFDFGEKINSLAQKKSGIYHLDLMKAAADYFNFRKGYISLDKTLEKLGKQDCINKYNDLNKITKYENDRDNYHHNARFDVFALWYIIYNLKGYLFRKDV